MVKPPRRSQSERRAQTRRAILDAAAELFAERGFHAVSLDEIGAHAGYTRGALHYNFSGKRELLRALLEERIAARGLAVAAAEPDELAAALPYDRTASLLLLEFASAAARDADTGAALLASLAAGRDDLRPAVAELLARAGVQDAPLDDVTAIVGAFVNGLSIEALAGADLADLEARFALLTELLLAGLRDSQRPVSRGRRRRESPW